MADSVTRKFYVHDPQAWEKISHQNGFSEQKLEVKVVERGIILPARDLKNGKFEYAGGVCDSGFNFVAGFSRKSPDKMIRGGGIGAVNLPIPSTQKNLFSLTKM